MTPPIAPGVYRHYKGRYYLVLNEAMHSETQEILVVYQPLYGPVRWFVRPKAMFLENVATPEGLQPRFAHCGDQLPNP